MIQSWWEGEPTHDDASTTLVRKLCSIRAKHRVWNRSRVGNIVVQKDNILDRIASLDSTEEVRNLQALELEERTSLKLKLNQLLAQEESLWKQQSHIQWLNNDNCNTNFFHIWASNRKWKNLITEL